jgi:3-hydroxyacyl-CoA dehydrogenase / enoyl-CoA hydratase / 3-hydroxybutyryl-CoA epimerase
METQPNAAPAEPARLEMEDGIAVIRMDLPGKAVNVLSRAMAASLEALIGRLERGEGGARAAVLLSEKEGTWIAGADIEEFADISTAEDGERVSRDAHALLSRLEQLPIPVVAAIDGAALGGGLEVALACTYRLATDAAKTKLGLPEVQLGILPGAGGTQRLPRLIGLRPALDMMLTGKQLDGRRARKLGLVDEVVPAAVIEREALRAARALADGSLRASGRRERGSPSRLENLFPVRRLVLTMARREVLRKTKGLYPAPLRILEVVGSGLPRRLERGLELEARAFGELAVTPEARALAHLFLVMTEAKNDPRLEGAGKPPKVERAAVVGAGFMGAGIAAATAEAGMRVRLKDITPEAAAKGLRTAHEVITSRARKRRRPKHEVTALRDRVEAAHTYAGFQGVDLVVEAVFEDVDLKHRVIREIEAAVDDEAIIGSNTSTIPIARLAEAASRPERVIGLHFFSPVDRMPLLEIITAPGTSPAAAALCHAYGKRLGKTPIVVNDAPGFYVNRILSPYMAEAAVLLEEGVRMEAIDRAMTAWGYPVGPITLYDEVGLDVAQKAGKVMAEAFSDRMTSTGVIDLMVEDGRLGRKNGRGFFTYEKGKKKDPDADVYALIGEPEERAMAPREIQERLAMLMVNEAVRTLEEGVVRSARDGDVGAILGIGFPPFRGGPFWYVDRTGAAEVLATLERLRERHGPRFEPAPLLREMAAEGALFYD